MILSVGMRDAHAPGLIAPIDGCHWTRRHLARTMRPGGVPGMAVRALGLGTPSRSTQATSAVTKGLFMARRTPATCVRFAMALGAAAVSAVLLAAASAAGDEVVDGAAAQGTPTIAVTPSTGLTAGQTVTVTGSGFTPNQPIGVSLCEDPFVDSSSCDFSTAKVANSDGSGGFTMSYSVVDTIKGGHSCVPTGCLMGASNLSTQGEFGNRVSLTFADGSTTTTTDGTTPTTAPTDDRTGGTDGGDADDSSGGRLADTGASDMLPYLVGVALVLVVAGVVTTRLARNRAS